MDWPAGLSAAEVREVWVQGFTDVLAWGLVVALLFLFPLVVLFSRTTRCRGFWCARSGREVEVEFEEHGLPGFRRAVAVKRCSVFEPSNAVGCGRRCLDADFRRQWPAALPIERA